jgi:alkanesulfonate monooxygenase SsuD/methylene tetrahydromethanopterin reductase-like flavin-dependent oxidoreductase (luciferase family)
MKIGLSLSGLLQHEGSGDMVQRFADVLDLVRFGRELGFDYIYAGQHYLSYPYQMLQPLISMARLSAETDQMDLLSTVLVPLQNPVQMAEDIATLDVLTNGKVIINAALGYRDQEYQAFGVEREDRISRMFENLEIAQKLWSGDEVNFQGRFTTLENAYIGVKPIQKPHPRIWIAANGDGMVKRIARMGYVWYLNPHAPYETLSRQLQIYRNVRKSNGYGDPSIIPMSRETFVADTRQKAIATARPYLEGKYVTYAQWGQDKALPGEEDFTKPFEELTEGRFIIGSPEDVISDLKKFDEIGVTHASLRFGWPGTPKQIVKDAISLAASEVLPHFRDSTK